MLIEMAASLTLQDGSVAARAKAKFLDVPPADLPAGGEDD
jgi:hypothetical protein